MTHGEHCPGRFTNVFVFQLIQTKCRTDFIVPNTGMPFVFRYFMCCFCRRHPAKQTILPNKRTAPIGIKNQFWPPLTGMPVIYKSIPRKTKMIPIHPNINAHKDQIVWGWRIRSLLIRRFTGNTFTLSYRPVFHKAD